MNNTPTIVNSSNLSSWFSISDADGISSWSGNTLTVKGVSGNERVKLTALVDMAISFDYTTTSFCKISLKGQYICDTDEDGSYSGTLLAGQSFHCYFSNTTVSQTCTYSNIACTKMEKKVCYVGVDGKARKVKKIYVGDDNVAHRVKKAYVGVGGVARIWWTIGLTYDGTATDLGGKRFALAATTLGNYAMFGGGMTSKTSANNTIYRYNKSLTRSSGGSLSAKKGYLAATSVGNYALFAGGASAHEYASSYSRYNTVDAVNTSGTVKTADALDQSGFGIAAATVGNLALFAGGGKEGSVTTSVSGYNQSFTKHDYIADLTESKYFHAATTVGNYAIFGGGASTSSASAVRNSVDAYDSSGTKTQMTALSSKRYELAATNVGNYALFAGGTNMSSCQTTIDVYNSSLTKMGNLNLSTGVHNLAATKLQNYAIFSGGHSQHESQSGATNNITDAFDESLTLHKPDGLSTPRAWLSAATIGSYALFAGGVSFVGSSTGTAYSTVDVYTC